MAKKKTPERLAPWLNLVTLRRASMGLVAFGVVLAGMISWQKLENFLTDDPRFVLLEPEVAGEASPSILVRGVENASPERVRNVFVEDPGRSLYLFPSEERRESLLAVDWVKDAAVSRIWPNRVEVRIEERIPVAYVQVPSGGAFQVALIDADGVILAKPPQMDGDLPILTGVSSDQEEDARAIRVRRALELLEEIGDLQDRVSEIDVSEASNIKVTASTGDRSVVLELGRDRYRDKMLSFFEHWPEIHRRLPGASQFDLRLDDRITALDGVTN